MGSIQVIRLKNEDGTNFVRLGSFSRIEISQPNFTVTLEHFRLRNRLEFLKNSHGFRCGKSGLFPKPRSKPSMRDLPDIVPNRLLKKGLARKMKLVGRFIHFAQNFFVEI